jgi:glycerol kinase
MATSAAELSLAAFEAIVLQIEDVVTALEQALGASLSSLNVDGGPTANAWLVQLLANLSQRKITRTDVAELSAVGVAALAGAKIWQAATTATEFTPKLEPQLAKARRNRWNAAVKQVLDSATN